MKPKKLKPKKTAVDAVKECQVQGWAAGIIISSAPWLVQDSIPLQFALVSGVPEHYSITPPALIESAV